MELPESIGELTKLENLYLGYNSLSDLPESVGKLVNLQTVNIAKNQLLDLPLEVGNWKKVVKFSLHDNMLSEIPPTIGKMTSLVKLYLDVENTELVTIETGIHIVQVLVAQLLAVVVDLMLYIDRFCDVGSWCGQVYALHHFIQ